MDFETHRHSSSSPHPSKCPVPSFRCQSCGNLTDLFSIRIPFSSPHITTASSLTNSLTEQLKLCPSDIYIIAQQQAVSDADFTTGKELPHLRKWISKEDGIKTASTVASVKGTIKVSEIVEVLEKDCGAGTLHVDASSKFLRFNKL